jgi:hypothetical protein
MYCEDFDFGEYWASRIGGVHVVCSSGESVSVDDLVREALLDA